jgi:hypothetical protein
VGLEHRRQLFEHRDELELQLVTPFDYPLLVAVLRQQPLAVELDRFRVRIRVAASARSRDRCPERVDVHPDTLGRKTQKLARGGDEMRAVLRIEHMTCMVDGLPQIRGRSSRIEVRPQHVHHLLAVKPMAGRESEELDDRRRLALAPFLLGNNATSDGDSKSAEQLDPKIRQCASLSATTILQP